MKLWWQRLRVSTIQKSGTCAACLMDEGYTSIRPSAITDLATVVGENMRNRYSTSHTDPTTYLALRRSLKVVNEILKEFAAGKLPQHHRAMAQVHVDL
jgi:hypothetical protein